MKLYKFLLQLLPVIYHAEAWLFLTSPRFVSVPQYYTTDYIVWKNVNASCYVIVGEAKKVCNYPTPPKCRDVFLGGGGFKPCDRCEISGEFSDMFYEQDMSIVKKACPLPECNSTYIVDNCIPAGKSVTVGVRCWRSDDVFKTNNTALLNVTSVFNSNIAGCASLSIPNGYLSTNNTTHCSTVTVQCRDGYSLVGKSSLTCHEGNWSSVTPSCYEDCSMLSIPHGRISVNESAHGTKVNISCDQGYSLHGVPSLVCFEGTWRGATPSCYRDREDYSILSLELIVGISCAVIAILLFILCIALFRKRKRRPATKEAMQVTSPDLLQNAAQSPCPDPSDTTIYWEIGWQNPAYGSF